MPVVSARYGDGRLLAQAYIGPHAGRQQVARQRGRRPTLKVAQLSSATASGQRSATSLASMICRYIIWRNNHACRFMISWCQAGRVGGPGGGFSFASIAWRPRTSRAVQFNFTGRQVALQVGRRPDPLDPRHAGQVVQGRPRCPLNIAVHRRHYSTVQGIGHNHSPLQQAGPACTRTESKPAYLHDDQSETQVDHRSAVIYPAGGNGSRAESALGSGRRVRWFRTGGDLA
jgi:hypothetical protein